ncbi:MAG TPA: hypothetical protein VH418_19865 [Solirubrobacteraceae bacterium]
MQRTHRASRTGLAVLAVLLVVAVALGLVRGGAERRAPVPTVPGAALPDPFAWAPGRDGELAARAAAGTAHVLYVRSPGGVLASAARTARWRPLVERTARAAGVSADRLEALVFLESAGRPDALTPAGIQGAAGLTQILAETGRDLLGMRVDTRASARATRRLARARGRRAGALERARARADQRFDPAAALAATGRYLALAKRRFGREDLAFVSYHMGIGNLQGVLRLYGGGRPSYAQLYFDSTPRRHAAAYARLATFGDDSANYLWKLGAAERIMHLYRTDRAALARTALLHLAAPDARLTLQPADAASPPPRPVPELPPRTGLTRAAPLSLQPAALALALYIGAEVRSLAPGRLELRSADPGGWAFDVARRYASRVQALAFQFVLDRLQVLNVLAYTRTGRTIHVTAAPDASRLRPLLAGMR